jgi:hypothetical protein
VIPLAAVLADERKSAPLTHLGPRLLLTAVLLAFLALCYWGMWRGWRARQRRQSDVPPPAEIPADLGPVRMQADGTYVVTTNAGDWLDRIAVHRLGERSEATLSVHRDGVLFARTGAPDLFIPVAALRGVRLERGMAGKFVEEGGLVVVTWRQLQHSEGEGSRELDTGFRPRVAADRDRLVDAVSALVGAAR